MQQPNRNALALLALMGFGFFVLVLWYGQQYLQTGVVRIEQIEKLAEIAEAAKLEPTNPTAAAELVAAAAAPAPPIEATAAITGPAETIAVAAGEGEAAVEPSGTATAAAEAATTLTETVAAGVTVTETAPSGATLTETVTTTVTLTETVAPASPLAGTSWALLRLNGVELLPDTQITAEFLADGTVTGAGSCNTFAADYTTDGDQITFSTPESTVMGVSCPQATEIQESAYLVALQAAAKFSTRENKLTIENAQGTTILEYETAQVE